MMKVGCQSEVGKIKSLLLKRHIPEIQFLPQNDAIGLDSIYVHDPALVYSKLLPVPFRDWLLARDIQLLEVPDEEYDSMGCNVLAVAPRKCIMLSGNPRTKALLLNEGVEVWEYASEEISRKGAGGPICLTRPILRE